MSRYVNVDELLNRLPDDLPYKASVKRVLTQAPTADVVEVVRCKDCKYWDTRDSEGIQGICLCGEKDFYYGSEFYPFADDYCSYGERSENGT